MQQSTELVSTKQERLRSNDHEKSVCPNSRQNVFHQDWKDYCGSTQKIVGISDQSNLFQQNRRDFGIMIMKKVFVTTTGGACFKKTGKITVEQPRKILSYKNPQNVFQQNRKDAGASIMKKMVRFKNNYDMFQQIDEDYGGTTRKKRFMKATCKTCFNKTGERKVRKNQDKWVKYEN